MATTPPDMLYASGTNYKFRKEDLSRAIFCAQVVSHEDDTGAKMFLEQSQQTHPGIQFDKIQMSVDSRDKHQKFLVAYANDATFIAFRGTKTLEDVTDTFQFDENCKRHFHKGFLKRSDVFDVGTGPHVPMFELLSKPGSRIILCGHAVGGAVSHMILLRFLLYYGEWDRIKDDPNSIISIAFGAPHVCDEKVAEEVNKKSNFKERFINFVNEADPVPRLLHDLQGTVAAGLRAQGTEFFNSPDAKSWKNLVDLLTSNNTEETNPREFRPIGQYAFLHPHTLGHSLRVLPADSDDVREQLQGLQFTKENLKYHDATSYKTAMVNAKVIDNPSSTESPDTRPLPAIIRPQPEVDSASVSIQDTLARGQVYSNVQCKSSYRKVEHKTFRAIDAGGRYVILQGRNLSFLRKTVTLNGTKCEIIRQSDSELWVIDPFGQGTSNAMIWTWFGQIEVHISENGEATTTPDSAENLFPKIVQTWVLMAKVLPVIGGDSWEKHQDRLDNIVQCVNEQVPRIKLSSHLKDIGRGEGDISGHIKEAVNMGNEVKKFMQSSLQIDYKPSGTLPFKIAADVVRSFFAAMVPATTARISMTEKTGLAAMAGAGAPFAPFAVPGTAGAGAPFAVPGTAGAGAPFAVPATAGAGVPFAVPATAGAAETAAKVVVAAVAVPVAVAAVAAVAVVAVPVAVAVAVAATAVAVPVAVAAVPAAAVAAVVTFVGGVPYGVYRTLTEYHIVINSTDAVLDLAIKEVLEWQCSPHNEDNNTEAVSKETKLQWLVDKARAPFKTWVETLQSTHNSPIQLMSHEFQEARPESMFRFLKRIKIVMESRSIYRDTVEGKCFVGILGAEDVGKSTFIRKALDRNKSSRLTPPEVGMGMNDHTKIPKPYQAENLWLVDFPGGNSIEDYGDNWQHFTALPSFVVLLLEFKADLKQDQKDMYNKMKDALNTKKIIVAFNKVDSIRPDAYKKGCTIREYFDAQRTKTSNALDCDEDKIHYLCLDPDPELPDRFKALKEQGVLDFQDFYEKVLDNAKKWQHQLL